MISAQSPYQTNFAKRQPRQRYDAPLLPTITYTTDNLHLFEAFTDAPLGMIKITGSIDGRDGFGNPTKFDAIEVTLNNGMIIPAYRIQSPDNSYNICQNYSYKAIKPTQKQ